MAEIPQPRDSDSEDVVWGLQTADTLWKRGERIDALVWLRRAAQAAGDANDDDRAFELARHAAELTEFMNSRVDSIPPHELADDDLLEEVDDAHVDVEVAESVPPPPVSERPARPSVPAASEVHAGMFDPWAEMSSRLPVPAPMPEPEPEPVRRPPQDEEVVTSVRPNALVKPRSDSPPPSARMPISSPPPPLQPPTRASRPSFGGMKAAIPVAPPPPAIVPSAGPPKPPPPPPPLPRKPSLPRPSVPKIAAARPVQPEPEAPVIEMSVMPDEPSVAPEPPPEAAPMPVALSADEPGTPVAEAIAEALERGLADSMRGMEAAQPLLPEEQLPEIGAQAAVVPEPPAELETAPEPEPPAEPEPRPEEDLAAALSEPEEPEPVYEPQSAYDSEPPEGESTAGREAPQLAIPSIPPAHILDLENVEAFADLPDDAREAFAAAATLHELNEGEEIATFALAYVVRGAFEVAATMVDAPAGRLEMGQVLRSRGTTEENVPIRMIAAGGSGVVATWSDASVEEAFRTIPWVEDDLRAAADKMQTLVGITIGPLGERLDMSIREQIVSKLKMRPLIPAEIVVNKGETVPGLLLVGIGELELVKGDEVTGVVGSGEFLFPTEVLGMGDAPLTARAGKGGALVMFGDRGVAQELLVTCPPLLEVFAGM